MADLDDFFAKKDKKRNAKKKFTTSEELVKKLEKSEEKPKKERPVEQEGDVNQVCVDVYIRYETRKKKLGNLGLINILTSSHVHRLHIAKNMFVWHFSSLFCTTIYDIHDVNTENSVFIRSPRRTNGKKSRRNKVGIIQDSKLVNLR